MEKQLDDLLKHALTPTEEPEERLNQRILNQVKEQKQMEGRSVKRWSTAVGLAAMVLCLSSATVYGALKYLSPADVAEKVQDTKLAEVFLSDQAVVINEKQSSGGYCVTLLSIVSGEMLSDYSYYNENNIIMADRTYVVIAIENADGIPMPDTWEDTYREQEFFASPLIGGYNPAKYNIAALSGGYTELVEDGVLYRLLECDNVEMFADHDLYLCVTDGTFYQVEAYDYEEATGKISRREEYPGLNVLFNLKLDDLKANTKKATEYMSGLGYESDISEEKLNISLEESPVVEVLQGNEQGVQLAEYALQFVGNPYKWGGDSLTEGADSSGFVKAVYEQFKVSLPHASGEQQALGEQIGGLENAAPGDLIFYETPAHVAIYIGDGRIVHAMPEIGICISEVDFDEIFMIRRILK